MKNLYIILAVLVSQLVIGQNQPPVAVNDTMIVYHADSTFRVAFQLMNNDYDSNGDTLAFDTISYNGTNQVGFIEYTANYSRFSRVTFKANPGFVGWDSIQYTIRDVAIPTFYDTAMLYIFVAQKSNDFLDLNNIRALIDVDVLFPSLNGDKNGFEVPKGSSKNTIFAANPWMAGKHNNTVYSSAKTYGTVSMTPIDYIWRTGGPISNSYEGFDFHLKWDRVWKVSNPQLQYHIANWFQPNYQPPQVFLDWPAHGDTTNGQAFYLAPFVDKNNDGIYNPYDGDYPQFKGQQAIYFINNDYKRQNSINIMEIETHGMAYVYDCPSDSALNHTVFLDLTFYNRSNKTYDSTYVGLFTDFDLGNPEDDYVGCDVDRSVFYAYNGDAFDEDGGAAIGYGAHPPYQGVTFLKGAKQDDDGIDNAFGIAPYETVNGYGFGDGITDNEHWGMEHFFTFLNYGGFNGVPTNDYETHLYLKGKWRDNTNFVYGGNGHVSGGGTIPTKYLYPNSSDTYYYGTNGVVVPSWSGGGNVGSDVRGVGSTGPFTFAPQQSVAITLAMVFGRDYTTQGNLAGLPIMQERVDSVRSYFLNNFQSVCGGTLINSINDETGAKQKQLTIYPNPFNNQFTVEYEADSQSAYLAIYNLMGVKIAEQPIISTKTKVDVGNISNGIYFVIIQDGIKKFYHKLVKQ